MSLTDLSVRVGREIVGEQLEVRGEVQDRLGRLLPRVEQLLVDGGRSGSVLRGTLACLGCLRKFHGFAAAATNVIASPSRLCKRRILASSPIC